VLQGQEVGSSVCRRGPIGGRTCAHRVKRRRRRRTEQEGGRKEHDDGGGRGMFLGGLA
jgi:hypothetical protein